MRALDGQVMATTSQCIPCASSRNVCVIGHVLRLRLGAFVFNVRTDCALFQVCMVAPYGSAGTQLGHCTVQSLTRKGRRLWILETCVQIGRYKNLVNCIFLSTFSCLLSCFLVTG